MKIQIVLSVQSISKILFGITVWLIFNGFVLEGYQRLLCMLLQNLETDKSLSSSLHVKFDKMNIYILSVVGFCNCNCLLRCFFPHSQQVQTYIEQGEMLCCINLLCSDSFQGSFSTISYGVSVCRKGFA